MCVYLRVFVRFGNDGQDGAMTNNNMNVFQQRRVVFSSNLSRVWYMCGFRVLEHLNKNMLEIIMIFPFLLADVNDEGIYQPLFQWVSRQPMVSRDLKNSQYHPLGILTVPSSDKLLLSYQPSTKNHELSTASTARS